MSDWFYALGDQRQGPVSAAEINALLQRGELSMTSLVWTEGMAEWKTVQEMSTQLGLSAPSQPEPFAQPIPDPLSLEPDAAPSPESIVPATVMPEAASPYAAPNASMTAHFAPRHQGDVVMAGFLKRFAAASIDGVILGVVAMIIILICVMVLGGAAAFTAEGMASELAQGTLGVSMILLMYGLPILVQIAYYTWMHASGSQATLGKMAVGIKVCRGDGQGLTLGRSFGRWCAYFFINLVSCGIGTLVSAFTSGLSERKQGLHDMMADTLVVDKWAFTAHPERQRRELGAVTWVVLVLSCLVIVGYFALIALSIGMAAMGSAR